MDAPDVLPDPKKESDVKDYEGKSIGCQEKESPSNPTSLSAATSSSSCFSHVQSVSSPAASSLPSQSINSRPASSDPGSKMSSPVTETDQWVPQGDALSVGSPSREAIQASNGKTETKRPAGQAVKTIQETTPVPAKKRKTIMSPLVTERKSSASPSSSTLPAGKDAFCWYCHKDKTNVYSNSCPKSFHSKCMSSQVANKGLVPTSGSVDCPECSLIRDTEKTPSKSLRSLSVDELNDLILLGISSLEGQADASFHVPVVTEAYPDYEDKIVNPVSIRDMERKAKKREYRSPFAFVTDVKWIHHNSVVYNNNTHPLTKNAKEVLKAAQTKLYELETCPDCFRNFHEKPSSWFSEVCRRPHTIVWAQVRGHPFWPAKMVDINKQTKAADVRFFGGHER